jgi:hypothetical protein
VRKYLGVLLMVVVASTPLAAQTKVPIRIKCGGGALTDSKGQIWTADEGFSGGLVSKTTGNVSGTPDPNLFQTGRTAPDSGKLTYTFQVANGTYHVNLYFAELNSGDYWRGARLFNVKLQGAPFLENFDIFGTVGAGKALVKSEDVTVKDGTLQIELDTISGHDRAKVTAIEITEGKDASAPQLALNFVYPDGTPVAGTLHYTVTTSQLKLGGNAPLANGQATCVLYAAPQILGLVGQVQLNLSLVDTAGHTLWQVGMTLDSSNANIAGVQSSALSVVVQKAS